MFKQGAHHQVEKKCNVKHVFISKYLKSTLNYLLFAPFLYLKKDIDDDNQERVGQVEEEPYLYRLDVRGAGQTVRNCEIDGGQNHQGGDVQL